MLAVYPAVFAANVAAGMPVGSARTQTCAAVPPSGQRRRRAAVNPGPGCRSGTEPKTAP